MDRADLLLALSRAASAAALGQNDMEAQRALDGKPFEIRIRFGCKEPTQTGGTGSEHYEVRFDEQDRTLRIRIAPEISLEDPRVAMIAGEATEAVEGFWMQQWLLTAGCPIDPPSTPKVGAELSYESDSSEGSTEGSPTMDRRAGLAQFFSKEDARTNRRDGRAYEATKILSHTEAPSEHGYNLVLSGRLRQLQAGNVISCRVTEKNRPPFCLVSADFDRVWIELPGSNKVLAEWGS